MPADKHYNTRHHREWSAKVMKRAGYLCEDCKRYGKKVPATIAHHIVPINERPDLAYVLSNGRALCDGCHNKKHPEKGGRNF